VSNFDAFDREVDKFFEEQLPERCLEFQLKVAGDATDGVMELTPVLDGLLRFNWQGSVGAPIETVRQGSDLAGDSTAAECKATLKAQLTPFANAFLSNPTPYAPVIEDGGYPSPVKRGTRVRNKLRRSRRRSLAKKGLLPPDQEADYEIRSAGGFSKQAPQGMVGVTVLALQDYFERD